MTEIRIIGMTRNRNPVKKIRRVKKAAKRKMGGLRRMRAFGRMIQGKGAVTL